MATWRISQGRSALYLPAFKWVLCKGESDTEITQWVTSATLDVYAQERCCRNKHFGWAGISWLHWFLWSNPLLRERLEIARVQERGGTTSLEQRPLKSAGIQAQCLAHGYFKREDTCQHMGLNPDCWVAWQPLTTTTLPRAAINDYLYYQLIWQSSEIPRALLQISYFVQNPKIFGLKCVKSSKSSHWRSWNWRCFAQKMTSTIIKTVAH